MSSEGIQSPAPQEKPERESIQQSLTETTHPLVVPVNPGESAERSQNRFTIDDIKGGSAVLNLEAALAVQVGKVEPIGYDEAANFFRQSYNETTDAHCVWLVAEAEKAGTIGQLRKEFPDVEMRARRIITHMQKNNPQEISAIMERVSRPDYNPEQIRKVQENAGRAFNMLFKNTPPEE